MVDVKVPLYRCRRWYSLPSSFEAPTILLWLPKEEVRCP